MIRIGKSLQPLLFLLFAVTAHADGPTAIHGVNNDGETVSAHVEEYYGNVPVRTPLYPLYEQWSIWVEAAGKPRREFKSQHCRYSGPIYQSGWSFSCARIGTSPLAGATYQYQKDLKKCGGHLFVCTSGCPPRAPRQMVKDYWECHEEAPVCPSRPKTGKLSGDSVNLRDKPGAAGKILRTIAIGTRIEVLARNEQCLDIDNKTGQWIKVRLADDQPVREGWIFDGYVDYSGSGNQ